MKFLVPSYRLKTVCNGQVKNGATKFNRKWKLGTRCTLSSKVSGSETESESNRLSQLRSNLKGVIGLEIHAQICTKSKLFSGSANQFGGAVNRNVSFLDASLPGTLPVLNKECVTAGVKTALALNCQVQKVSMFDRKHYFYADLPVGYQITQQRRPLAINGRLDYIVYNPAVFKKPFHRTARIIQLQLEQDSGKSVHDEDGGYSLIDLNRAGTGLMEIVTEPDFASGEEAAAFVKELQSILIAVGTCDGKMAEGSLRVDANISVHQSGEQLGVRTEVKNINSIRNVAKAIEFEIQRQTLLIQEGGKVINETRAFDMESGETVPMRDKEIQQDYRFMPEPNLPPLRLFDDSDSTKGVNQDQVIQIDKLRSSLPELPEEKRTRLRQTYNVTDEQSIFLVNTTGMVEYFELILKSPDVQPKTAVHLLKLDVMHFLKENDVSSENCPFSVHQLVEICKGLDSGSLSKSLVQKALHLMVEDPLVPFDEMVRENNLLQITDLNILQSFCEDVINDNVKDVIKYKAKTTKQDRIFQKLVTKVMIRSEQKANGKLVVQIMKKLLEDN